MNPSLVPLTKCALIRCKQRAPKFPQFLKLATCILPITFSVRDFEYLHSMDLDS